MRLHAMTSLSLLLCACGGDASNGADSFGATDANEAVIAPADDAAGDAGAPRANLQHRRRAPPQGRASPETVPSFPSRQGR